MKLLIVCILLFILQDSEAASAPSTATWKVYDDNHDACILMEATIGLNLSYVLQGGSVTKYAYIPVPSTVAVNPSRSSCKTNITAGNRTVLSQVLHIDFDANTDPGWSIEFAFTQDSDFHASDSEFSLYSVTVVANYSTRLSNFSGIDPKSQPGIYTPSFDFSSLEPSIIADEIYANIHYSYFCASSRVFPINEDSNAGRTAWVTLKNIRVQAFAPAHTTKFGDREICPDDQTDRDIVPVIVGSVLSGVVLITLIIYLVYRARQPPAVLYLTNPESHFEDLGVMKAEKDDEEEDDSSRIHIGHPNRVAKHLHEPSPGSSATYDNAGYIE